MSGTPRVHRKRPTTPSTQKAQTVTQRRVIHGAGSKSKIPIEEEVDLRGEKVSLKSGMKRCTGGRSTKSERKRIPDSWSSKEERSTSLGRFEERYGEQMNVICNIYIYIYISVSRLYV